MTSRDPDKGRASPYGIYDLANNVGFVNVGMSADTAAFAAESIRRWWATWERKLSQCHEVIDHR